VTSVVLDASALLAFLRSEPGADKVASALADAVISAVNYSEVLKKTIERGGEIEAAATSFAGFPSPSFPSMKNRPQPVPPVPAGQAHGMSFADRACLALGIQRGFAVLTTSARWLFSPCLSK